MKKTLKEQIVETIEKAQEMLDMLHALGETTYNTIKSDDGDEDLWDAVDMIENNFMHTEIMAHELIEFLQKQ